MIQRIHSAHLGIEGCLRRARECLYWPGITAEVKDFIQKCDICRSLESKQQKETLHPHEIPTRPWTRIGADLCVQGENNYLITVDYFSNFWEIDYLEDTTAKTVIRKLKANFARHGIPDVLITDNGPQFTSEQFKSFTTTWEFTHTTSSPYYPQSNGKAEQAVKMAKTLLKKAKKSKSDPYLALLDFRNTPS